MRWLPSCSVRAPPPCALVVLKFEKRAMTDADCPSYLRTDTSAAVPRAIVLTMVSSLVRPAAVAPLPGTPAGLAPVPRAIAVTLRKVTTFGPANSTPVVTTELPFAPVATHRLFRRPVVRLSLHDGGVPGVRAASRSAR